jgi:beta-lactam-binding protein with PASTA domain
MTDRMKFGSRVWGIGKFLLLVGALGATFLVFFTLSMRVALRAGQVQVPDLTNRAVGDATGIAAGLQLHLRVEEKPRPSATVPVGSISQQDPQPGVSARPERTIRVWISSGPQVSTIPSLLGLTERTVQLRVGQDGLATTVSEFRSSGYEPDTVVAQDPAPRARAAKVAMLVNRAEEPEAYVMPDLTGLDARAVDTALRGRGFEVTIAQGAAASGAPPGAVISQRPAAGTRVTANEPVSLEVSR